jgi:glycosyltransferase involved in cell wall biosynthesis
MHESSTKKVSVILPVYNAEKYVGKAIQSILNQTHKNLELVIINDGSTDKSLKIINKYKKSDDRIVLIDRENRGLVSTLNEALKLSTGEYIMRMDADDISVDTRIELQLNVFKMNPSCALTGCFVEVIDEQDNRIEDDPRPSSSYGVKLFEGYGCAIGSPTMMFRRNLVKEIGGFSEESWPAEDYEWQTRILNQKGAELTIIPKQLYKYRINGQGISQQNHRLQALATVKYGNLARKMLLTSGWRYTTYSGHRDWLSDVKQWNDLATRKRMMDIYYTTQLWFRQDDIKLNAIKNTVLLFLYTIVSNPKDIKLCLNRPKSHYIPNE